MNNETETNPQQQDPQDPSGSVNTSDSKNNPSHRNQGQIFHPPDVPKKNPSQDSDSQHKSEQKPQDEKRRAS
jgi:hypothetical protein